VVFHGAIPEVGTNQCCRYCCVPLPPVVAGKLFEVLAAGGAAEAAAPMLTALGQICAGLSDAAEQREAATLQAMEVEGVEAAAAAAAAGSSSYAAAAEAALGLALK